MLTFLSSFYTPISGGYHAYSQTTATFSNFLYQEVTGTKGVGFEKEEGFL